MPKASKPAAPPPHTQSTLLAIYEWALDQDNAELVGCMQRQGVKVPNDDHSLQLRQDLYNLKHLEDKQQEPGGAAGKNLCCFTKRTVTGEECQAGDAGLPAAC